MRQLPALVCGRHLIQFWSNTIQFQICLTGSCYTTIAITIERFLAIRLPFFMQRYNIKARHFVIPVFFYAIIYNIPRFFEYRVVYNGCLEFINGTKSTLEIDQYYNVTCENPYALTYTEMRQNQLYLSVSAFPKVLFWHLDEKIIRYRHVLSSSCMSIA